MPCLTTDTQCTVAETWTIHTQTEHHPSLSNLLFRHVSSLKVTIFIINQPSVQNHTIFRLRFALHMWTFKKVNVIKKQWNSNKEVFCLTWQAGRDTFHYLHSWSAFIMLISSSVRYSWRFFRTCNIAVDLRSTCWIKRKSKINYKIEFLIFHTQLWFGTGPKC